MARLISAVAVVASLCGCNSDGEGGGGPNLDINCAGLTGGTATTNFTCTVGGCGVIAAEAAADGDLGTYAILNVAPNSSGGVSIRVTAAEGVTYPGGTPAAVVYGLERDDGDSLNTVETVHTYLDGALQESGATTVNNGTTDGDREAGRHVMGTTLDFDAIELSYTQTGGTADLEVRVYEFCTSAN